MAWVPWYDTISYFFILWSWYDTFLSIYDFPRTKTTNFTIFFITILFYFLDFSPHSRSIVNWLFNTFQLWHFLTQKWFISNQNIISLIQDRKILVWQTTYFIYSIRQTSRVI